MNETQHTEEPSIPRSMRTLAMNGCTQRFSLGPKNAIQTEELFEQQESLEVLIKKTWTIWAVSSLFGFQPDSELQLKLYSKKLREEVATMLPREDVKYDAKFTILDQIEVRPSPDDSPAIQVQVFSQRGNEDGNETNIYTGIFMSWRTNLTESICKNTTKLPLLLCRGTKSAQHAVRIIIGRMFDCVIVPLDAPEDVLEWLVPIMLSQIDSDKKPIRGTVRLEYGIPRTLMSNRIVVTFNVSTLQTLWTAICDNETDHNSIVDTLVTREQVSKFHQSIQTKIVVGCQLQLGLCQLNKIFIPSFTIKGNRMRATTTDAMNRVLLFFNERALQLLHKLDYDATRSIASDL